jgi:hypothetical protein
MKQATIISLAIALLLTACGGADAGTGTSGPAGDETDPTDTTLPDLGDPDGEVRVVLTVSDEGGFVPVEWNFRRVPRYVVMSDGTVFLQGPVPAIYPGPALPNTQKVTLDEETLARILELIDAAGLPDVTDERNDAAAGFVADAPDTVFTFTDADGVEHRLAVYALGIEDAGEDPRIPALIDLLEALDTAAFGAGTSEPYEPAEVDVFAGVREPAVDDEFSTTREWPLDMAFEDMVDAGVGFGCAHLTGQAAQDVLDLFAEVNEMTFFTTDDATYTVIVRPLLPGQGSQC